MSRDRFLNACQLTPLSHVIFLSWNVITLVAYMASLCMSAVEISWALMELWLAEPFQHLQEGIPAH